MRIRLRQNNEFGLDIERLRLVKTTGPECEPSYQGNSVKFVFGLDECGTNITSNEDYIIYENKLIVSNDRQRGDIQREHNYALIFRCLYNRKRNLDVAEYTGLVTTRLYDTVENGQFALDLGLYHDRQHSRPILPSETIDVHDRVYVDIEFKTSSDKLDMAVQSCVATPENIPPSESAYSYPLIENGCFADDTVSLDLRREKEEYAFSFQAFVFRELGNRVFVHCSVIICQEDDTSATCENPTASCGRHKRALDESVAGGRHRYVISHGPLDLTGDAKSVALSAHSKVKHVDWLTPIAVISIALLVVATVFVLLRWGSSNKQRGYTPLGYAHET